MKKVLLAWALCVFSFALVVGDAEAKRLGGGRSTGMQRESASQRPATPQSSAVAPAAAPAAAAPKRNWMGPLAGLAAGLGIAALLSHFGMGDGLSNIVMIALLAMAAVVVFKFLFRRKASSKAASQHYQYAGAGAPAMTPVPLEPRGLADERYSGSEASPALQPAATVPADFDVEGFLRVAKLNFIRLQAANDAGNLGDIREFVAPEMFAEIKLQLDERGKATQQTDVVRLNAELIDVVSEASHRHHIASVRFSGMIREEAGAAAAPFVEIWNLSKLVEGDKGWVVAGIQQVS